MQDFNPSFAEFRFQMENPGGYPPFTQRQGPQLFRGATGGDSSKFSWNKYVYTV